MYLQVKKTRPGIGKEAIMAALPCDSRLKHVIVVDEDIDLFNESDVLWSVAYRSQWDKDLVVVKGAAVFPFDPGRRGRTHPHLGLRKPRPHWKISHVLLTAVPTRFKKEKKYAEH